MNKKTLKAYLQESEKRIKTYGKMISESEKSFRDLNSENMQGTLIQIEDFLDSNHLYAFENWMDGVIYDGPNVKRYWVDITLKYPYESMPDPRGGMRLYNLGSKLTFKEEIEFVPIKVESPDDLDPLTRKPKEEERKVWLVNIRIPRKFIEDAIEDEPELQAPQTQKPEESPNESETSEEENVPEEEL